MAGREQQCSISQLSGFGGAGYGYGDNQWRVSHFHVAALLSEHIANSTLVVSGHAVDCTTMPWGFLGSLQKQQGGPAPPSDSVTLPPPIFTK
jgi:hypothetical protein